jgi:hypothetical protein
VPELPPTDPPTPWNRERAITAILLGVFLLQGIHGLAVKSGTCDELGAHLPAGILYWKSGRFGGGAANPPLGQLLVAAGPVLAGTADRPLGDTPGHLLPARVPVLALGLVTALVVRRLARRTGGRAAGRWALGAAALSPGLIAHARFATLDLPSTAFFVLACLLAWEYSRSSRHALLAGFALAAGTAALVKLSALHLFPAVAAGSVVAEGTVRVRLVRALRLLGAGTVATVALAWLAYGPGEAVGPLPAGLVHALETKWAHGRAGHFAYLFGERSATGFPHYFVAALAVKTPLPLLIAAALGVVSLLRKRLGGDARGFLAFVALPAAWILLAMSLVHRVDIGVRHVLPVLPALLVLAGVGCADLASRGTRSRALVGALAGWMLVGAARITPDHLSYFHELAGGPSRGDLFLIDSNIDWGQDEGRLRAWAEGREVRVNPDRPCSGLVAANVNALRGILSADDGRLGWLDLLTPIDRIGWTWRIYDVDSDSLRRAASRGPGAALHYAHWLVGTGHPEEAIAVLGRNDVSRHERYAARWNRVRAEAALAVGDLATASRAVRGAADPDLAIEIAYRVAESGDGSRADPDREHLLRTLAALSRRGRAGEAADLARRTLGQDLMTLLASAPSGGAGGTATARREKALRYRAFGLERRALEEAAAALAADPADEDALWLYGELVVRRKLGLTEYPLPEIDWSGVGRENPERQGPGR